MANNSNEKRERTPPLNELKCRVEQNSSNITVLQTRNLESLDSDGLYTLAETVKESLSSFKTNSSLLYHALKNHGCNHEARESRRRRAELTIECQDFVHDINLRLEEINAEQVSVIQDTASIVSSLSRNGGETLNTTAGASGDVNHDISGEFTNTVSREPLNTIADVSGSANVDTSMERTAEYVSRIPTSVELANVAVSVSTCLRTPFAVSAVASHEPRAVASLESRNCHVTRVTHVRSAPIFTHTRLSSAPTFTPASSVAVHAVRFSNAEGPPVSTLNSTETRCPLNPLSQPFVPYSTPHTVVPPAFPVTLSSPQGVSNTPRYNATRPIDGEIPFNLSADHSIYGLNNTAPQRPYASATTPLLDENAQKRDPSAFHYIKESLMRKPDRPFSGNPTEFHGWIEELTSRMRNVTLNPREIVAVFEAHTTGKVEKQIQDFARFGDADSSVILHEVWTMLFRKYGSSLLLSKELEKEVEQFTAIKTSQVDRLEALLRLCKKVLSNIPRAPELQVFNFSSGLARITSKLPEHLQLLWRKTGHEYMETHGQNPTLCSFIEFLSSHVREVSNEFFTVKTESVPTQRSYKTLATEVKTEEKCILHNSESHQLYNCRKFVKLDMAERRRIAIENRLCFRCLGAHNQAQCTEEISCEKCNGRHRTAMHNDRNNGNWRARHPTNENQNQRSGFKSEADKPAPRHTQNLCTAICNDSGRARSCSRTLLVDVRHPCAPSKTLRCYCIVDEMSSGSFVDPSVATFFGINAPLTDYTLTTMNGFETEAQGRLIEGLTVRGVGERKTFPVPPIVTNSSIPGSKREIASPATVAAQNHVAHLAKNFLEVDEDAEILMLLGRDSGNVLFARCYGNHFPFVYHTSLGWALIGEVCPQIKPKEKQSYVTLRTVVDHEHYDSKLTFPTEELSTDRTNPFIEHMDDDLPGLSKEDQRFNQLMATTISVNQKGNLTAPLPFKSADPCLPDNRNAVFLRTSNTLNKIKKDPSKLHRCLEAMGKNIAAEHVEMIPDDETTPAAPGRAWWVPVFPVIQPQKNKLRLVFDSSARYHGTSLNDELLQGPDETNKLRGVLTRFREGEIAYAADVEQMFHAFHVPVSDRDWMRFFWFRQNDPRQTIVQYRACVHVFGNRSSPAIANYALRYTTTHPEAARYPESQNFIVNRFYVDDGLGSSDTVEDAINTLRGAREILQRFNIRLHKIVASDPEVTAFFPSTERAEAISITKFGETPVQRTLGVSWKIKEDMFVVQTDVQDRPFTKRGVLATINSIFDPLGIAAPVVLTGKLIQRAIMPPKNTGDKELVSYDWDDELPDRYRSRWESWKSSLSSGGLLAVPRSFTPRGFGRVVTRELHVFADASCDAIGSVMYTRCTNEQGKVHVAFVTGASRVAPHSAVTIPRLELCAAVEAANYAKELSYELQFKPDSVTFYSDSNVVLAYIKNDERRFSRYVTRRVNQIISSFPSSSWNYIATDVNPADIASRPHSIDDILSTPWLEGPSFLWSSNRFTKQWHATEPEELPETLKDEVCLRVSDASVHASTASVIARRVSSWPKLLDVFMRVVIFCRHVFLRIGRSSSVSVLSSQIPLTPASITSTLVRHVQRESFPGVMTTLESRKSLCLANKLAQLSPFIDECGVLRVGGRLRHARVHYDHKFPALLPSDHPVTTLVVRHYHAQTKHQGRHLTNAAIRQAGFFIQAGTTVIRKVIAQCVTCSRLRGSLLTQQMSDLPPDRLEESPPFTNTGLDVFGPFYVSDGRNTRRTSASKKLWGLLFTCLVSRAVHVEPLPGLDTSTFKNALARFFAIRGNCKILRSDQGSNFVGANNQDDAAALSLRQLASEAQSRDCEWIFNPPHASHFGGVWERKIQSIKRVLDSCVLELGPRTLSRDEMHTLFQEAASIVNKTPLTGISAHPDDPLPITPSLLLTLKDSAAPVSTEELTPSDLLAYGPKRWRRVQYLADVFWSRWRQEVLSDLLKRRKWLRKRRCVKVGDVVIVRDKKVKRNCWPCGRVIAVKTSVDELVRSVTISIPSKNRKEHARVLERPISEIVPLLSE